MSREAYTYWLRFPDAQHWRRWESNADHPSVVACEAARELKCSLPIRIEVRQHNEGGVFPVNVLGVGPGPATNGTIEELDA